ncbi:RING finger protein 150-like isoform X2 [Ischnura elegans]|uniref:RING finger protein 150-like isoform X2 n=1 Tax=Ischnura elegans TaxID=197161 RepID=UPI001ED86E56|nr:RING finger protein 150-like isoform X2 [Ischnura elegans]
MRGKGENVSNSIAFSSRVETSRRRKMFSLALVAFLALSDLGEAYASGPSAVVDWTRGATGGVTVSSGAGSTVVSLEEVYTTAFLTVMYTDPVTNQTESETRELGKYGEGLPGNFTGILVHVGTETNDKGCHPPLKDTLPSQPWVALIRRGDCNFDVKVENAYQANAAGVIVFDDRDTTNLSKMLLSPNRNISAIFIQKWKGEELIKLIDNGTEVIVLVSIGNTCTRSYGNINSSPSEWFTSDKQPCLQGLSSFYSSNIRAEFRMSMTFCDPKAPSKRCLLVTSVLFVSISFIVLMIISLAWLVFYYIQRFRYIHAKDRLARRLCNAAKKALSKIPTKHIKSEDREIQGEGECCAVCIEPYKISDVIRILPCKHEYHKSCIDPWLLEHRTCPMCKMDILKYYGFMFTGSQESILHIDMDEAVIGSTDSHEQSSPAAVAVGGVVMIPEVSQSRGQVNPLASSQSESEDQVASSEVVSSRAPSPDEFTPSLGHVHCNFMVVSEIDTVPSNSLSSSEKVSKSSNKDEVLQKDGQVEDTISCDRISLNSEKFPPTNLVKDSSNESDSKTSPEPSSEPSGLSDVEKGDSSGKK